MKKLFLCILLALVCIVVSTISAPAAILYFTKDTYTEEATPNTNWNNQKGDIAKKHSGNRRFIWIEFVVGSDPVSSASLNMYWYERPTGWGAWHYLEFRASTTYEFNESTLTWNTQPDASGWTYVGTWKAETLGAYQTLDIKDFWNANLGKRVTLWAWVPSGSQTDCGGCYEDREGSAFRVGKYTGEARLPYISYEQEATPPSIITHPTSQTKCVGESVTFSVTAGGSTPLNYQWKKDGSNVGTNSSIYTISSVAEGHAGNYTCYVWNSYGNATSNPATLTVNTTPAITADPTNQTKCVGESVTFSVTASGSTPLNYQWKKDGSNVGTNSANYTISSVAEGHAGSYTCYVWNSCGATTSAVAEMAVNTVPSIIAQPIGAVVYEGASVTLGITAAGTAPLSYRWRKGGYDIPDGHGSSYSISSAVVADTGSYDCVVTNVCGSATSNAATLSVSALPISEAKKRADGMGVRLSEKTVTALFSDHFYVSEADRSIGIMIAASEMPGSLSLGDSVDVVGTIRTNAEDERYVEADLVTRETGEPLQPVGMNTGWIGGADFYYDSGSEPE